MKTVLVFGTFDNFHPGHKWFLKKASKMGERLLVTVSRDKFVQKWKGQAPVDNEKKRLEQIASLKIVDMAVLADAETHSYNVILTRKPDIICLGHDQKELALDIEEWLKDNNRHCDITILPPWKREHYSSTKIRKKAINRERTIRRFIQPIMLFAMFIFGFGWVSGKILVTEASPSILTFFRFLVSCISFIPFFIFKKRKKINRVGLIWTLIAAASISIYSLLFFTGLRGSTASQGVLLVTTLNPLFTFLITSVCRKLFPSPRTNLGLFLGVIAGLLMIRPFGNTGSTFSTWDLWFLGAALAWSLMTISAGKAQRYTNFARFNLLMYFFAFLIMMPFALMDLYEADFHLDGMNMSFWINIIFLGMGVSALGTGLYFMGTSILGPAKSSSFTYLVPLFGMSSVILFLNDYPNPVSLVGAILAIIAVLIINNDSSRQD